jgi:hypothetical protein
MDITLPQMRCRRANVAPADRRLDVGGPPADDPAMDDDLDAREAARIRRRDREAAAEQRELMRPGMGKVFKQILDRQGREAREEPGPGARTGKREPRGKGR